MVPDILDDSNDIKEESARLPPLVKSKSEFTMLNEKVFTSFSKTQEINIDKSMEDISEPQYIKQEVEYDSVRSRPSKQKSVKKKSKKLISIEY